MRTTRILTKSERKRRKEKIVSFVVMLTVCILWVLPLIYMFGTSFKSDLDLQTHPETLFPSSLSEWTMKHYTGFIVREGQIDKMPIWMLNSIWSTLVTVVLTVGIDLLGAYAVVFLNFKGRQKFTKFLMLFMTVPAIIGTAPSFAIYAMLKRSLALSGVASYIYIYMWIILPSVTGIFNFLLMRSFLDSIPQDIIDSAKSDGAGHAKIFKRIVMPMAKSTILLIVLFAFTGSWNNLMFPQMLLASENRYWHTVTVALTSYTGSSAWGATGVKMATSVFAMIPIIIIFCITQDKMIDGMATTGIKG